MTLGRFMGCRCFFREEEEEEEEAPPSDHDRSLTYLHLYSHLVKSCLRVIDPLVME